MLTSHKVSQHKVSNGAGALESHALFWWVHAVTCCIRYNLFHNRISLLNEPSISLSLQFSDHFIPNIHLTPESVPNENLTCSTTISYNATSLSPLSSFHRITLILDILKIELTKNPCIKLVRMGSIPVGRAWIMVVGMGSIPEGKFAWRQPELTQHQQA